MLAVNSYPQDYVDACRASVDAQLAAFEALKESGTGDAAAIAEFEPLFLQSMVLALDARFCHRSRTLEGKDGNPMNEVRVLCTSITHGGAALVADKSIKLRRETSVLGLEAGDPIALDVDGFRRLADAFFAGVEATYA